MEASLARGTYLDALSAALFAGRLASGSPGPGMRQVARGCAEGPPPASPTRADLLLEGMAVLYTEGYPASAPLLHRAMRRSGAKT